MRALQRQRGVGFENDDDSDEDEDNAARRHKMQRQKRKLGDHDSLHALSTSIPHRLKRSVINTLHR